MNALVTIDCPDSPAPGPHGEGHTIFTPRAQGTFLSSLQLSGNVRLAARAAGVSRQTAYRQRRRSPALARLWDAALLAARDRAEEALADRALNGVEEAVFYHGEEVARRRRYDARLLLAHLARLDRLAERAGVSAALGQLDDGIESLLRGEELAEVPILRQAQDERGGGMSASTTSAQPEPVEGHAQKLRHNGVPPVPSCGTGAGETLHSSNTPDPLATRRCGCPGAEHGTDRGRLHFAMTARGPEPVCNVGDGKAPCCDKPRWPDCRECPHYPLTSRLIREMEEQRPEGAPDYGDLGGDKWAVEAFQMEAFAAGDEDWWRMGEDYVLFRRNAAGIWVPEEDAGTGDDGEGMAGEDSRDEAPVKAGAPAESTEIRRSPAIREPLANPFP